MYVSGLIEDNCIQNNTVYKKIIKTYTGHSKRICDLYLCLQWFVMLGPVVQEKE